MYIDWYIVAPKDYESYGAVLSDYDEVKEGILPLEVLRLFRTPMGDYG